jgi:hypothetical protein
MGINIYFLTKSMISIYRCGYGRDNKHPCNTKRSPNQFVFQYNFRTHLANHALISRIDDIIVTNQRRTSASLSSGIYHDTRLIWMKVGTRISELLPLQLHLGMLFKWWTNCLCFYWYFVLVNLIGMLTT